MRVARLLLFVSSIASAQETEWVDRRGFLIGAGAGASLDLTATQLAPDFALRMGGGLNDRFQLIGELDVLLVNGLPSLGASTLPLALLGKAQFVIAEPWLVRAGVGLMSQGPNGGAVGPAFAVDGGYEWRLAEGHAGLFFAAGTRIGISNGAFLTISVSFLWYRGSRPQKPPPPALPPDEEPSSQPGL